MRAYARVRVAAKFKLKRSNNPSNPYLLNEVRISLTIPRGTIIPSAALRPSVLNVVCRITLQDASISSVFPRSQTLRVPDLMRAHARTRGCEIQDIEVIVDRLTTVLKKKFGMSFDEVFFDWSATYIDGEPRISSGSDTRRTTGSTGPR